MGWKETASKLEKIYIKNKNFILLFNDRTTMSEMIYYLHPHPLNAQFFNPSKKIVNQFAINTDMNGYKHKKNFILITKHKNISNIKKYFAKCKYIKEINVKIYKNFSRKYYVFKYFDFKGY